MKMSIACCRCKIFILFALIAGTAQLHAQENKFISVKGIQIIEGDGKAFLIKGINLGNWLVPEGYMFKLEKTNSPRLINEAITELIGPEKARKFWDTYLGNYITEADIHYLKELGVNSIRLPFNYRLFTDEDYLGGRGEARGFALLDQVVGWCRNNKIFLLLDMHCAPGGQTGDNIDDSYGYPFLFENEENQTQAMDIWSKIAQRYKDETTVMGYELLNEPIPHFVDTTRFNKLLEPLYKKLVAAIRKVDNNHLVFLGGAQWDTNFDIFGKPFDSKAVYTFHKYAVPPTKASLQPYLDFRTRFSVPIYCGETGENTDEWNKQFRIVLDKNDIGWYFWTYKKLDNARCITTFKTPLNYDKVIQYIESPRANAEEIRKVKPRNIDPLEKALFDFATSCKVENCYPNKGFIQALGLGN